MVRPQVVRVFEDGLRAGDALVSAAAADHHGQGAAAHARVGTRRRGRAGLGADVVRPALEQGRTDVGTPASREALARDGLVHPDLVTDEGVYVPQPELMRELPDGGQGDGPAVGGVRICVHPRCACGRRRDAGGDGGPAVVAELGDVGVALLDAGDGRVAARRRTDAHVQVGHALRQLDDAVARVLEQVLRALHVLGPNGLQHLERCGGIAAQGPERRGGLYAAHAARVGHGHALHVLDDVARAGDLQVLGTLAQRGARERGGERDGDGLRAAQGADELLLEDGDVVAIGGCFHGCSWYGWDAGMRAVGRTRPGRGTSGYDASGQYRITHGPCHGPHLCPCGVLGIQLRHQFGQMVPQLADASAEHPLARQPVSHVGGAQPAVGTCEVASRVVSDHEALLWRETQGAAELLVIVGVRFGARGVSRM